MKITKKFLSALVLCGFCIGDDAAEELNEALLVNPYDVAATAGAIKTAMEMPAEEKEQRFQSMKEKVREHNSEWWLKNFQEEWEKTYA